MHVPRKQIKEKAISDYVLNGRSLTFPKKKQLILTLYFLFIERSKIRESLSALHNLYNVYLL